MSPVLVEREKEYVQAARVIGLPAPLIAFRHVLPNVMGPVLVIATINLALAVITEATLSFLGVGVPPTEPSLGTLIRIGNNFLFSGDEPLADASGASTDLGGTRVLVNDDYAPVLSASAARVKLSAQNRM